LAVADHPIRAAAKQSEGTTMAKTRGTGLLMVWTDIDAEFRGRVQSLKQRGARRTVAQVPEFLSAGRYLRAEGRAEIPRDLRTRGSHVLPSAAYLDAVKYQPSSQRLENRHSYHALNAVTTSGAGVMPTRANRPHRPRLRVVREDLLAFISQQPLDLGRHPLRPAAGPPHRVSLMMTYNVSEFRRLRIARLLTRRITPRGASSI
jgi:hypothetical protein